MVRPQQQNEENRPLVAEISLSLFCTLYADTDNTPPGSDAIAYPKNATTPSVHTKTGGTGTYADPITVAVDIRDFPVGTRFYSKNWRAYGIAEDECAASIVDHNNNVSPKRIDWWAGGKGQSYATMDAYERSLTQTQTIIVNPDPGKNVIVGAFWDTGRKAGNTTATQNPAGSPDTSHLPGGNMALATMKLNYGAVGNGSTNDSSAFSSVPAGSGAYVEAGTYQITTNCTISGNLVFAPGAILRAANGVTVQWAAGATVEAGNWQIFDTSGTGTFNAYNVAGWAKSSWFPGGASRDLGVQLNKGFGWGFTQIDVPPAPDHVIRTTVKLLHAVTVRMQWHGFPRHVYCQTNDKPVFEAVGDVRHWRIEGGVFDGDTVDTPSCFLLVASDDAAQNQCGDTTAISETHITGAWGQGIIVNIGAEVLVFQNVSAWIQGRGDTTLPAGPQAAVVIGNADYWTTPYTYTKPTAKQRSCSAMLFDNCDLRGGQSGNGQTILLKGRVEDIDFVGTYFNSQGKACLVAEGGKAINPDNNTNEWSSPRNIGIRGGRTETNNGLANDGCPTVLIDAINTEGAGVDTGLYGLTIGKMGHFVGTRSNTTPIVKTVNGGLLDAFFFKDGGQIFGTNTLLEHTSKDLNWADIKCREPVNINCTGRSINDSDIKIGGSVFGTIGPRTVVRSANVSNWPNGGSTNPPPPSGNLLNPDLTTSGWSWSRTGRSEGVTSTTFTADASDNVGGVVRQATVSMPSTGPFVLSIEVLPSTLQYLSIGIQSPSGAIHNAWAQLVVNGAHGDYQNTLGSVVAQEAASNSYVRVKITGFAPVTGSWTVWFGVPTGQAGAASYRTASLVRT